MLDTFKEYSTGKSCSRLNLVQCYELRTALVHDSIGGIYDIIVLIEEEQLSFLEGKFVH